MGSYSGTCEIVEATDEINNLHSLEGSSGLNIGEKERKLPVLRLGARDSIEDDINQLFESFYLKNSSKGSSPMNQVGSSPLRKNALKKPITVGVPRSPGLGNSESVNLKQALRDLCLSKASEMAAMKRLSKSSVSSAVSEAGRIKTLYDAKIVDAVKPGPSGDGNKGSIVEISLVPEESTSDNPKKVAQQIQAPSFKASKESALPSLKLAAGMKYVGVGTRDIKNESKGHGNQKSKAEARHKGKRSPSPTANSLNSSKESMENLKVSSIKTSNQRVRSPSPSANSLNSSKESLENLKNSSVKTSNQRGRSPRLQDAKPQYGTKTPPSEKENISAISRVAVKTLKWELAQQEDRMPEQASSTAWYDDHESLPRHHNNVTSSNKSVNKSPTLKARRKGRLRTLSSSSSLGNGNRGNKLSRITPRVVKPVIRNKNMVKKLKQDFISASKGDVVYVEAKESNPPTTGLVCERCQCSLMSASKEFKQETLSSHSTGSRTEVNSSNVNVDASKVVSSSNNGYDSGVVTGKAQKNPKLRDKGELSQSSKSSLGEYSSSTTSISTDDSNLSRSSCSNRPHMSKDLRWEAIRRVRRQHGPLGLRNFNLLKKLGCGDIGTVYLAELIGTNCSFAIKVMDNEFLVRRKKMSRAQTEREILKMLDHPFLPTLYSQFTAENLSCLVMEYCPGGDLHVLRQKQPGRHFLEPAAKFYVAEVLLALEYLHMLGVVYRDLKPENILVKEDGHIMLTDFDLSLRCSVNPTLLKSPSSAEPVRISGPCTESSCIQPFCVEPSCKVPCFSPRILPSTGKTVKAKADGVVQFGSLPQLIAEPTDARSNSFVGTHEYLAPEIIRGKGHGAAVDWWTFGVFLYELLYGRTPFKGPGNEETLTNVVLQGLEFPDTPKVGVEAQDLIRGLLVKDPESRLGTEKGAAEIKQHPFFQGLNWALIRCATPPELPDCYEFGSKFPSPLETQSKYLDRKTTGEHLEFELF